MARRQILRINPDILLGIGKRDGIRTVGRAFPLDAVVVNRMIDERGDILLLVESGSYADVPDGQPYPDSDQIVFRNPTARKARNLSRGPHA